MNFSEIKTEIKILKPKKLVGLSKAMCFANNTTAELWRSFMLRRKEILNTVSSDLYSIQYYDLNFFENFNPEKEFIKWAALEVSDFGMIPEDMQTLNLPAGDYAVFYYKGLNTDTSIFQYILGTWLPASGYHLALRPHFELLGPKYQNNSPESEEEIWIPIQKNS